VNPILPVVVPPIVKVGVSDASSVVKGALLAAGPAPNAFTACTCTVYGVFGLRPLRLAVSAPPTPIHEALPFRLYSYAVTVPNAALHDTLAVVAVMLVTTGVPGAPGGWPFVACWVFAVA
jgi:hypothetical protein